jgi:crotonobetainyl-CoA:carnitine CoA-transferase CaiB-like acyl-CoA transferase
MAQGLLDDLKVIDLSQGIAGPMATMILADQGARVVKVEPPGGDPWRVQTGYQVWQRGKRSVELDLKTDEGRRLFLGLARDADVIVDSFALGTAEKLGIGWDVLSAQNPGLIGCSITGYGDTRHSARPAIDALVQARTGLFYDQKGRKGTAMSFIAGQLPDPDLEAPVGLLRGANRKGPVFPRTNWPSLGAAYLASLGIAGALLARERTGKGQRVDTSLLQGALAAVALNWQRVEHPEETLYWMWPLDSRSIEGLFECSDGRWVHHWVVRPDWVTTAAAGDALVAAPLNASDRLGMEIGDLMVGNVLYPDLKAAFLKFPSLEWIRLGEQCGVGVALVRSPAEALADPSFIADGCVVSVQDKLHGQIRHVGPVLEFPAFPGRVQGAAPLVGQHTDEVNAEALAAASEGPVTAGDSSTPSPHRGPLDGMRVLDFGLGVAGPFGPKLLADLGADVIKINAMYDGFWTGTHMGLGTNRGKRSIAIDLKSPTGREVLDRLLATTDVVATNWRATISREFGQVVAG